MKKNLGMIAVALSTALVLTGCAAAPSTSLAPQQEQQQQQATPTVEDMYLQVLRATGNSYITGASDSDLIQLGHTVCEALDAGNTVEEVIYYLAANSNNNDPEFARFEGQVIGAAVPAFCPEYSYQIDSL